ncbi:hypothetical protein AAVH_02372 [Aphelenchoides avenae]|nr:hypothetical protein AAVH_02372 [Aphelenchus avenae]
MDEASSESVTALDKSKDEDKPSSKKYHFDDEGRLIDEEGSPYKYTKAEYENVASSVTDMVYERLTSPPLSLKKTSLTDKQPHWREEDSFVFISDNIDEADKLVVIIHGSGQVHAGQWSRRLIINESLEIGSQIPYIRRCREHGWAVLVTNTNDNYYVDEKGKKQKKAFSGTPIEHGLQAWGAFVFHNKNLKKIAIVAHSFGGHVTGEILSRMRDDDERVVAVCLTDAFVDSEIVRKFDHRILACNWVGSSEPLDTESDDSNRYMKVVSAGTKEHERTSHCCIDSVFRMIEEAFGSTIV